MSRVKLVVLLVVAVALAVPAQAAAGGKHDRERPSRVLILVLDQARPDTIKRYDMDNVQRLQREGMNFPNALVGHMAAETVISHNVLTSGLFPKNMGWTNEVYRDTVGALAHGAAGPGLPRDLEHELRAVRSLIEAAGYWKLQDYLDDEVRRDVDVRVDRAEALVRVHRPGTPTRRRTGTGTDPEDIIFQIRGSSTPELRRPTAAGASPRTSTTVPRRLLPRARRRRATAGRPGRPRAPTAPTRFRRRTSTRSTATASCRASTPRTSAATSGTPTPRSASSRASRDLARHDGQPRRHRQARPHVGAGGQT